MSLEHTNHGYVQIGNNVYPVLKIYEGALNPQEGPAMERTDFTKTDGYYMRITSFRLWVVTTPPSFNGRITNRCAIDSIQLACWFYSGFLGDINISLRHDDLEFLVRLEEKARKIRNEHAKKVMDLSSYIFSEMDDFIQLYPSIFKKDKLPSLIEKISICKKKFETHPLETTSFEYLEMRHLHSVISEFLNSIIVEFIVTYEIVFELMRNIERMFEEARISGMYLEALDGVIMHFENFSLMLRLPEGMERHKYELYFKEIRDDVDEIVRHIKWFHDPSDSIRD